VTRRRSTLPDPTGQRATSDEYVRQLRGMLDGLSERETSFLSYRFGLLDGRPRSLNEVGRLFGISHSQARLLESATMSKLRHPSRLMHLCDFLEGFVGIPERVRARLLGTLDAEPRPLVHCDRHGWSDPGPDPTEEPVRCRGCPCALTPRREGRRREYCSDACRQAVYRRRRTGRAG
jgi:hypothetical protein